MISGSAAWLTGWPTQKPGQMSMSILARSVAREEKARGPEPDATSACTCLSLVPVRACHHGAGGDAGGPLPDRDRAAGLLHLPTHGWTPISHARGNSPLRLGARARAAAEPASTTRLNWTGLEWPFPKGCSRQRDPARPHPHPCHLSPTHPSRRGLSPGSSPQ